MNLVYRNGKPISPSVVSALRYLSKVGVMTKDVWAEGFCKGSDRWKNKQLKILLDNGYLKKHPCDLGSFYVLADKGLELARDLKWPVVEPVTPRQIKHDEAVGYGLLRLEKRGLCKDWVTEKELKARPSGPFMLRDQGGKSKFPDSIFKGAFRGQFLSVALEYERTGKTVPRYRSILWSYNKITSVSMVLFIVEDEAIKRRIKHSLKYLGKVQLLDRIAFMNADDWIANPIGAPIEISSKTTSFEKLARTST